MKAVLLAVLLAQASAGSQTGTGAVAGIVRMADGKPAANTRIAAMSLPPAGALGSGLVSLVRVTQSDELGRYRLESIPPGRYYIVASRIDDQPAAIRNAKIVSIDADSVTSEWDITVVPPPPAPQTLVESPGFVPPRPTTNSVFGKILTENGGVFLNLPKTVVVTAKATASPIRATTQANGDFRLFLSPGEFRISVDLPAGYALKSVVDGSTDLLQQPLIVDLDALPGPIQIKLSNPSLRRIRGKVADDSANSTTPAAASVDLFSPSGNQTRVDVAADGSFEFVGGEPGDYRVRAFAPYYATGQESIVVGSADVEVLISLQRL